MTNAAPDNTTTLDPLHVPAHGDDGALRERGQEQRNGGSPSAGFPTDAAGQATGTDDVQHEPVFRSRFVLPPDGTEWS